MKRREFIINSSVLLGASTFLTGCVNDEIVLTEGQIAKRKFKNLFVPLLGFGCAKLPMRTENLVDTNELDKIIDYCIEHGANYFDTSFTDANGEAETSIGNSLKRFKREDFILADKCPITKMHSPDDVKNIFYEQLEHCKVNYFDFYMCQDINKITIHNYRGVNMYDELLKLKNEGKIKNLGFSFQGSPDILKEIVEEHKWDFCQLKLNYMDWDVVKAHELYDIVKEKNIPVIAMQPLKEGKLVDIGDSAIEKLKETNPNDTPEKFGLRWAASRQDVITVLSEMNNLQQVKDDIDTFMNYEDLTEDEEKTAEEVSKIIQSHGEINCTVCKDCIEVCPKNINIPAAFSIYNQYKETNDANLFSINYDTLTDAEKPEQCIKCRLCLRNCPQNLQIPDLLEKIAFEHNEISKQQ